MNSIDERISELAERARSYEQLAESFAADIRIFSHILTTEIVSGSAIADDLIWELRDSIVMDARHLGQVLSGTYRILERAAQRAIAEHLDREYMEAIGEDLQDRSIHRVRSYRTLS